MVSRLGLVAQGAAPPKWLMKRKSFHLPVTLQVRVLMQRHQLTAYDASYMEFARHRQLSLSTRDKALRRAAEAAGVFLPAEL